MVLLQYDALGWGGFINEFKLQTRMTCSRAYIHRASDGAGVN